MAQRNVPSKKKRRKAKPFLRWAGGKSWLLKYFDDYMPETFGDYHEPFLGGAAVFFHLKTTNQLRGRVYLSDVNPELINCYQCIQENVEDVIKYLKWSRNSEGHYYKLRDEKPRGRYQKAARFLYLNRTSFNGIYRVNQQGEFNVPYGDKKYRRLFDYENLRLVSKALQGVFIKCCDFTKAQSQVREGSLVFLDPPYTNAHGKNGFVIYNEQLFSDIEQKDLKKFIDKVVAKGAHFVLTNANHNYVKQLFSKKGYTANSRKRQSVIGGTDAHRGEIKELVFSNTI